jgi:cytosine/creatinine deaminase
MAGSRRFPAGSIGSAHELAACFDLVTTQPARLMNLRYYGVAIGNPADLTVLDCRDAAQGIAVLAQPLLGFKRGRRSFTRPAPALNPPA